MEQNRNPAKLISGLVILLIGAGLLIWALTSRSAKAPSTNTTDQQQQQQDQSNQEPATTQQAETATISFTSDGFNPRELTVKKGTVVTVKNESSTRVQFSSDDHPTHLENQGMNLRTLNAGESASFTADEVGKWGFHDHIDDSKTGTLTVTE